MILGSYWTRRGDNMRKVYLEWDELWPWVRERTDGRHDYVVDLTDEEYAEMKGVNEAFFVWQEKLKARCK
jgi:hypothetical protein